ncbi:MAG: type II toxin-antitoxin system Phd/YefM family antitoxin [Dehalococcoidia bacterium]|nr:type II toxin-antitoxin system Phd/YefM family antitoxin [Dehalococcoidia bacterium]
MLEVIPITQARKNFLPSIERVANELYEFVVTKHGKPVAVILSYSEYSRMVETLKTFEDKKLTREVKEGLRQAEQGELIPLDNVSNND